MRRRSAGRSTATAAALAALLCLLVLAASWLLQMRFERGDIYPRYSSLRADPLGTEVLAQALREIDGLVVVQNLEPLDRLGSGPGTTILVLGLPASGSLALSELEQQLEQAAQRGARVVVTFSGRLPWFALMDLEEPDDPDDGEDQEARDDDAAENGDTRRQLRELVEEHGSAGLDLGPWGAKLALRSLPADKGRVAGRKAATVQLAADDPLPETLAWHSPLVFAEVSSSWRVVYARGDEPVLIQRRQGRGSLVLATDSFFVSNEALQADRQPQLLAWMVGPAHTVVFDEVHLGVQRPVGIMVLARRYRLLGFFAALAVLAGLYVWRVVFPFAPGAAAAEPGAGAPSRTSRAALVNLLRRGLSDDERLLTACVNAWKRSFAGSEPPELCQRIERTAAEAPTALEGHRRIRRIVAASRRGGLGASDAAEETAPVRPARTADLNTAQTNETGSGGSNDGR